MANCKVCNNLEKRDLVIFEDEDVVAYLEPEAATLAHITVTTKKHYPNLDAAPDYLVAWCFAIANKLSKVVLETISVQGLNLLVQVGEGAGQQEDHFTVNVLPRMQNDNLPLMWTPQKGDTEDLKAQAELYKKATSNKWIFESKNPPQPKSHKKERVLKEEDGKDDYQLKHLRRMP